MNTKSDKLKTRIETIDRKAEAAASIAKQDQNKISNPTSESKALQQKLTEQQKKIHELEENTEDQVNRNSRDTLDIRNHIITSCIKRKRITTNSTNPYFILVFLQSIFKL